MRILIAFRSTNTDNIFVYALRDALVAQGMEVVCSQKAFWRDDSFYDIIHIQWPEELIGWFDPAPERIEELSIRLRELKERGSKIVYTRHNIVPHYGNPVIRNAYRLVEQESDMIVHMGRYSRDEYLGACADSQNMQVIIPHHIYEGYYNDQISRKEARHILGIPEDKFVITSFGKFRNREEIKHTLQAFLQWKCKQKYLLAPRMLPFSPSPVSNCWWKRVVSRLAFKVSVPLLELWHIRAGSQTVILEDDQLPYYLTAANVVFIQRVQILNSGNIPLAFLFGRAVVGPERGNLTEILKETGNPSFDPDHRSGIRRAFEFVLQHPELGEANRKYAARYWGLQQIGAAYIAAYQQLLNPS